MNSDSLTPAARLAHTATQRSDDDGGSRHPWEPPYNPAPLGDDDLQRRTRWHLDQAHAIRARWLASGVSTQSDQWWSFWSAETRHWQQLALNYEERTQRMKQRSMP